MVIALAIGFNCVVAVGCFYGAWRLWQLGRAMALLADRLAAWEAHFQRAVDSRQTPTLIWSGQPGTAHLRQQYAQLQRRLRQWRQLMVILGVAWSGAKWLGLGSSQRRGWPGRPWRTRLFQRRPRGERG